jgi:hypothetical protein
MVDLVLFGDLVWLLSFLDEVDLSLFRSWCLHSSEGHMAKIDMSRIDYIK